MLHRFSLILRFYCSSMMLFCMAMSGALTFLVYKFDMPITPLLAGKLVSYLLMIYIAVWPRHSDEFFYYRNLGIRRRWLLGVSCAVDFACCWMLLLITAYLR